MIDQSKAGLVGFSKLVFVESTNHIWKDVDCYQNPFAFAKKYVGSKTMEKIQNSKKALKIWMVFINKFRSIYRKFGNSLKTCENIEDAVRMMLKKGNDIGFNLDIFEILKGFLPVLGFTKSNEALFSKNDLDQFYEKCPEFWLRQITKLEGEMKEIIIFSMLRILIFSIIATIQSIGNYKIDKKKRIFTGFVLHRVVKTGKISQVQTKENVVIGHDCGKESVKIGNCENQAEYKSEAAIFKDFSSISNKKRSSVRNPDDFDVVLEIDEGMKKEEPAKKRGKKIDAEFQAKSPLKPPPNPCAPQFAEFLVRSQKDPNLSENWKEKIRQVLADNFRLLEDSKTAKYQFEEAKKVCGY
ncbi:unnamed protein product [Caenorhabditis angaria]|uniref:Uncharacterized protein n=1 Tax=Caenorhabditis angaria TaxID=860376 RepID=A0A9P1IWZ2_9PELO|nr:unnamed protein product [Caenorhabditis angaria]